MARKVLIVPNSFFAEAAEVLRSGSSVKLHVDGQSMYPFIRGGKDEIQVVPYDGQSRLPDWCCVFYQWEGKYMIHRLIDQDEQRCRMLGDGNVCRIEEVNRADIYGILQTIYHPDGTTQDCSDPRWIRKAVWWYRLRPLRRFLLPLFKKLGL